ncbi:MAG TPA: serine hydrolase domain-containing protein [Thermoanaerobaculia bacterium]|nr:serine hydrolase domain-containing protein [Thermoanaerobaculia bacterium]
MRTATLLLLALTLISCRTANLERELDATQQALRIPSLSVAVARDGEVLFVRGGDTRYPIGSITKTFTSTLMLQLAEEGKLDLSAPVAPLVDFEVDPAIRVNQVLSHTSEGRFAYSSRFNWLDNVVEAATTKESFAKLMKERVLQRAALTRTVPDDEANDRAEPHRVENGKAVRSQDPPLGLHSSSGLSSTVLDLIRYSDALDEHRLLSAAAQERAYGGRPYGLGWFVQDVAGERVVWHTSWWPDAYSGLLVRIPSRRLTLAVLANTDGLVAPQGGSSNVLLYPAANAFLRAFLGRDFRGETLVAEGLTERARGNTTRSEALLREAVAHDLGSISDDDRLRLFGESADPAVRTLAADAAQRLLAAYPDDLNLRFNAALLYGRVRPTFTINGPDAARALALLQGILAEKQPLPKWMNAWSSYLVAEHTSDRTLAERAKATGVNTDRLQERVEALLKRFPPAN